MRTVIFPYGSRSSERKLPCPPAGRNPLTIMVSLKRIFGMTRPTSLDRRAGVFVFSARVW